MIQKQFENHLKNSGASLKSFKNYKSDVNHFLRFVKVNDLSETIPLLSTELASDYKQFMIKSEEAVKSINRRLSTLRKVSKFLQSIEAINFDFAKDITNVSVVNKKAKVDDTHSSILQDFKNHLLASKVSHNTIKNYLSDTRHFLNWLSENTN